METISGQRRRRQATENLLHYLFVLPIAFAIISWIGFPILAQWLSINLFSYEPVSQATSWLWLGSVIFFYTWFTFLAVGVGGTIAIAAWLSRRKSKLRKTDFYPNVSFVVPAFNEEEHLPRCIQSLFRCSSRYSGSVEVIVVDDGSEDLTYEVAFASLQIGRLRNPRVRGRVIRHTANLGKVEALRTGVNRALGQLVAIVDADSWWSPDTLQNLVEFMEADGKTAVTGYVHPSDAKDDNNPYIILQQLEYSQGLGIFRCAQGLSNSVLVVPGAIGIFEARNLREILNGKALRSVTEDSEITLELRKKGCQIGYLSIARSETVAPSNLRSFWNQRLRWFVGWLHNTLGLHKDILLRHKKLSLLLWYCLVVEYIGAFVEFAAIVSFPLLFWFAPDRILFLLNLFWFVAYALLLGISAQAIALRFAYGEYNHRWLLYYTPFYSILWFLNLFARISSATVYLAGHRGRWKK